MQIQKNTSLEEIKKLGKECNQCGHCCKYGTGFLMDDEKEKIAKFLNIEVDELESKYLNQGDLFNTKLFRPNIIKKNNLPFGKCIFLGDNKLCRIHEVKPLLCQLGSCSEHGEDITEWFYLNYCVKIDDPYSLRLWEARLKVKKTIPGGDVSELLPDDKRRKEALEYKDFKIE